MSTTAARITKERTRRGWSRKQLASALGVHWGAIQRLETGAFEPRARTLVKLAKVFGCSTDYLLLLKDEREP